MNRHLAPIALIALIALLSACNEPASTTAPAPTTPTTTATPAPAPATTAPATTDAQLDCAQIDARLVLCPDDARLQTWAAAHRYEGSDADARADLTPADPVATLDGLTLYHHLLRHITAETRAHLDLWAHTPALNADERAWLQQHPEVWRDAARLRAAKPGAARVRVLNAILKTWRHDKDALRHALLRDGVFYFDDASTAAAAARLLTLEDLFDAPRLTLERAGQRYTLLRGDDGHYRHADPSFEGYRARLNVLDRVAPEGHLNPMPTWALASLRHDLALDHVELTHTDHPNTLDANALTLDGHRFEGLLVRTGLDASTLALTATPDAWGEAHAESRVHQDAIDRIKDAAFAFVREDLFFDEPANEEGQQDGIMRLAFNQALREGRTEYEVNGKTYRVFDAQGRPRPPQVCIDLITDAVERASGRWYPHASTDARSRTEGDLNLRPLMPMRQVSQLLRLAQEHPALAERRDFAPHERAPFEDTARFHDLLRDHRDELREADVIAIYGLRSDMRNHWHSFYVYETDPVLGTPTLLLDQAGHARLRPWNVIMRAAPKRAVHHRLRFNPRLLTDPRPTLLADDVLQRARSLATATAPRG